MINDYSKSTRERIERVQMTIERCKERCQDENGEWKNQSVTIRATPVASTDIENFENYPENYRLFVTEIGNLEVNSGYWALAMQNPLPYKSMDRALDNWTEELATVWCSDSDYFADHLPVVSLPCDNDTFAFDTKTIPYQLVDMYNEENLPDFLDWIVMVLEQTLLDGNEL